MPLPNRIMEAAQEIDSDWLLDTCSSREFNHFALGLYFKVDARCLNVSLKISKLMDTKGGVVWPSCSSKSFFFFDPLWAFFNFNSFNTFSPTMPCFLGSVMMGAYLVEQKKFGNITHTHKNKNSREYPNTCNFSRWWIFWLELSTPCKYECTTNVNECYVQVVHDQFRQNQFGGVKHAQPTVVDGRGKRFMDLSVDQSDQHQNPIRQRIATAADGTKHTTRHWQVNQQEKINTQKNKKTNWNQSKVPSTSTKYQEWVLSPPLPLPDFNNARRRSTSPWMVMSSEKILFIRVVDMLGFRSNWTVVLFVT